MNLIEKINKIWATHSSENSRKDEVELRACGTLQNILPNKSGIVLPKEKYVTIFISLSNNNGFSATCKSKNNLSLIEVNDEPEYDEDDNEIPCSITSEELMNEFVSKFEKAFKLTEINFVELTTSEMIKY